MSLTRPKLNLKAAYERVKSALTGVKSEMEILDLIAKNSAGNGIYNGKMTISQRGDYTSPTAATNNIYYLDRWRSSLSVVTGDVQDMDGSLRYTATSASGGAVIGGVQYIEDYAKYDGETITMSALVRSNSSEAYVSAYDGAWLGNSIAHSGNGEEELLTVTVPVGTGIDRLRLYIRIGSGGSSASIAIDEYIEFTDVRLDLGSHRLSGDREYGQELALCQRYYRESTLTGNANEFAYNMRATPSESGTDPYYYDAEL